MEKFKQSVSKYLMIWATLELWQKISILLVVCGVLVLLVFIVIIGGSASYARLYSDLEMDDMAKITDYLRENSIPYKLESGINAISVPKDQADEVRIGLSQANLPKGGSIGYEIFDSSKWGKSEFEQKIAFLRAIEGELTRTLKKFNYIEDATVRIVLPEKRLYKKDQTPSSAAVTLKLRSGYEINAKQVRAIVHLVTRSVPELQPERVTVVDTSGVDLSRLIEHDPDGFTEHIGQMNLAEWIQRRLERDAKQYLESSLGKDKVAIAIKIELNFNKKSIREIVNDPEKIAIRSRQVSDESYTGRNAILRNAPGTTTNIPGYSISTGDVDSQYEKNEATTNYEITSTETNEVLATGNIRRLTASVTIDGKPEGQNVVVYGVDIPISMEQMRSQVANAIGFYEARGDDLTIMAIPFSTVEDEYLIRAEKEKRFRELVTTISISLVLLLLGVGLALLWWKRRNALLASGKVSQETRHIPTIQEMLTSPDMIAAQGELSVLEDQIKAYARSNPKEVANLVNEWLSED